MPGIVPSGCRGGADTRRDRHLPRGTLAGACALALALLTFAAFSPALDGAFLFYDDRQYVSENPVVRAGLTPGGAALAITRSYAANWHPMTWLSLMLDVEIFGLEPRGFHLTNNLLHAANAALLFLLVRALTGALWRSAAVAALFAVHPLRVESVAWIVERKDVLAMFFGLLCLLAYVRHVRRPGAGPYLATTLCFALGLASKPVLVTWPLLMLVLDAWPLGRFGAEAGGGAAPPRHRRAVAAQLLREKAPWLLMSVVVSFITFVAQAKGGAVAAPEESMAARLLNVVWAYAAYLRQAIWPLELSAFYPFESRRLLSLPVLGSALALGALTALAAAQARRRPWLAAGWCWYLASLVPMIGVVRVGGQSMADRYTYVPLVGPVVALVWLAAEWAQGARSRRVVVATAAIATTLLLAGMTRVQAAYWLSDSALFSHMVEVVPGNHVGFYGLGLVRHERGDIEGAERYYRRSIASEPRYYPSRIKLARLYLESGREAEAEAAFREALSLSPDDAMAQSVFGLMLQRRGKLEEAAEHLRAVVELQPGMPEAHNNLGVVLGQLGRVREAEVEFSRAIAMAPGFEEARANLEAVRDAEATAAPAEGGR